MHQVNRDIIKQLRLKVDNLNINQMDLKVEILDKLNQSEGSRISK
jgi:hypothetical protein